MSHLVPKMQSIAVIVETIERYIGQDIVQIEIAETYSNEEGRPIKTVVVGTSAVGKTTLLNTYIDGTFWDPLYPTIFDNCTQNIQIGALAVDQLLRRIGIL